MTPVGAVSNRTASAQLETAPTKHGERKCLFIFRIHYNADGDAVYDPTVLIVETGELTVFE